MNMRIIFLIFFRRKPYLFYFFQGEKKKKTLVHFHIFRKKNAKMYSFSSIENPE